MLFKRKRDFKPDRGGKSLLNRLYLTPTQRLRILKWTLFALGLVALSLLQDALLSQMSLLGATTDLVCCGIFLAALLLEPEQGGVLALIASTVYYFSGSAPGPYAIALLTVLSLLLNIFRHAFLRRSFGSVMLCAGVGILVYEMLIYCIGLFLGFTTPARATVFLLTAGLSLVFLPVLYPVFLAVGKIGGETWKE
jgi:hypothetical protein